MRLTELEPQWLIVDGTKIGLIFVSPTKPNFWQSCFFSPTLRKDQRSAFRALGLDDSQMCQVQGCDPTCGWTAHGELDFETLTITPSLDGSAGGLWHGFITNGDVITSG